MKIGLYASMFGKDDPPTLQSIESYIDHAYDLRLDLIDFRRDRGFSSEDAGYLIKTKLACIEKGLAIGYLASGGHFVGSDEDLRDKVATAKADMDIALILGAPMIRLFCGQPLTDPEERAREIRCFPRGRRLRPRSRHRHRPAKPSLHRRRRHTHHRGNRPAQL